MRKLVDKSTSKQKETDLTFTPAIKEQLGKRYKPLTKR